MSDHVFQEVLNVNYDEEQIKLIIKSLLAGMMQDDFVFHSYFLLFSSKWVKIPQESPRILKFH